LRIGYRFTGVGHSMAVSVVTGATGGIGLWIARGLAQAGHHVVLVGRDRTRAELSRQWIADNVPSESTEVVLADLSLLSSTRALGTEILARHPQITVLVNNAGIFDARQVVTSERLERVLATNLLSPVLLSQILLPALKAGAPSRIVTVGSSTSDNARLDPERLALGDRWTMRRAYAQSKLALMMATFAIANQTKGTGVVANVVHPGLVATGLVKTTGMVGLAWRGLAKFALTSEQGAVSPLFVALAPEMSGVSGIYVKNRQIAAPNPLALDPALVNRTWAAIQHLIAQTCDD
jgi:NAD(P)-dependent dehydrogenase (short-subunit alcohol dehydrogenase family)